MSSMTRPKLLNQAFELVETGKFSSIEDVRAELIRLGYLPTETEALDGLIVRRALNNKLSHLNG